MRFPMASTEPVSTTIIVLYVQSNTHRESPEVCAEMPLRGLKDTIHLRQGRLVLRFQQPPHAQRSHGLRS